MNRMISIMNSIISPKTHFCHELPLGLADKLFMQSQELDISKVIFIVHTITLGQNMKITREITYIIGLQNTKTTWEVAVCVYDVTLYCNVNPINAIIL